MFKRILQRTFHRREREKWDISIIHLQIPSIAVGGVDQGSHFELIEFQTQHPVSWCSPEAPKSIPTGHRSIPVEARHLWRWDIHVDVHRFIAVVLVNLVFILSWYYTVTIWVAGRTSCGEKRRRGKMQLIILRRMKKVFSFVDAFLWIEGNNERRKEEDEGTLFFGDKNKWQGRFRKGGKLIRAG